VREILSFHFTYCVNNEMCHIYRLLSQSQMSGHRLIRSQSSLSSSLALKTGNQLLSKLSDFCNSSSMGSLHKGKITILVLH